MNGIISPELRLGAAIPACWPFSPTRASSTRGIKTIYSPFRPAMAWRPDAPDIHCDRRGANTDEDKRQTRITRAAYQSLTTGSGTDLLARTRAGPEYRTPHGLGVRRRQLKREEGLCHFLLRSIQSLAGTTNMYSCCVILTPRTLTWSLRQIGPPFRPSWPCAAGPSPTILGVVSIR